MHAWIAVCSTCAACVLSFLSSSQKPAQTPTCSEQSCCIVRRAEDRRQTAAEEELVVRVLTLLFLSFPGSRQVVLWTSYV